MLVNIPATDGGPRQHRFLTRRPPRHGRAARSHLANGGSECVRTATVERRAAAYRCAEEVTGKADNCNSTRNITPPMPTAQWAACRPRYVPEQNPRRDGRVGRIGEHTIDSHAEKFQIFRAGCSP